MKLAPRRTLEDIVAITMIAEGVKTYLRSALRGSARRYRVDCLTRRNGCGVRGGLRRPRRG